MVNEDQDHLIHNLQQQIADKTSECNSLHDQLHHLQEMKNEADALNKQLTNEIHNLR